MSESRIFDTENIPQSNLVLEANAGTGKTFSLVKIYLDMLRPRAGNKPWTVDQIPVLTFTEAASAEMQSRIATALMEVKAPWALSALRELPHAPIGTIHSFCNRLLGRFPMEMGIGFPLQLSDAKDLRFLFEKWVLQNPIPESLADVLDWQGDRIWLVDTLYAWMRQGWGDPSRDGLFPDESLRAYYRNKGTFPAKAEEVGGLLEKLEPKVTKTLPNSNLNALVLAWDYLESFHQFYQKEGPNQGRLNFNDMIHQVASRMDSPDLPNRLASFYRAIIVDEFQDTDRMQWKIIQKGFLDKGLRVVLIGDPKQSIYRFRGAEPNIYRQAIQALGEENKWILNTNFRSSAQMIQAANQAFVSIFPGDKPQYQPPIQASTVPSLDTRRIPPVWEQPQAPVDLLGFAPGLGSGAWPRIMAAHLAALLEGAPRFRPAHQQGEAPDFRVINPGDIAILVPSHDKAEECYQELLLNHIPARRSRGSNVFYTREALNLQVLFRALGEPHNSNALGELFLGGLLEGDWSDWLEFQHSHNLAVLREALVESRELLADKGVFVIWEIIDHLRSCVYPSKVLKSFRSRLLGLAGGARFLSNYRQILEALSLAQVSPRPEEIHQFLQEKSLEDTEVPLNKDGEEAAVRIITLHSSKGLEFPVVYFMGSHNWETPKGIFQMSEDGQGHTIFLQGVNKTKKAKANNMAELERLFYVAFTRASLKVVIPAVFEDSKTNPFSLNPRIWGKFLTGVFGSKKSLDIQAKCQNWGWSYQSLSKLPERVRLSSAVTPLAPVLEKTPILPKGNRLAVSSFSSIVRHSGTGRPEDPLVPAAEPIQKEESHLPRGRNFGLFFHHLLENLDFTLLQKPKKNQPILMEQIGRSANLYWRDKKQGGRSLLPTEEQVNEILRLLETTLCTPIPSIAPGFRLCDLENHQRMNECEFHLRTPEGFNLDIIGPAFDLEEGYLKGIVDMIFYVGNRVFFLDWKTNDLGGQTYTRQLMEREMSLHNYHLQGALYHTALHDFMKKHPQENRVLDMGLYVFLRGVSTSGESLPNGVFPIPMDKSLLDHRSQFLIAAEVGNE